MAYNDMDVVIYKILTYLYECMKNGVKPREEDMCSSAKLFRIPAQYWAQIIEEMQEEGLIKGFSFLRTKEGKLIEMSDDARITIKGGQYLSDNSRMKEVAAFLGAGFQEVISTMIKIIVEATI